MVKITRKFENASLLFVVKILLTLLQFHHVVDAKRLQNAVLAKTAEVNICSSRVLNKRDILELSESSRGKIECVRQCMQNIQCELAVYQEFHDGFSSCTKLSVARVNSSAAFNVSNSKKCVSMYVNPCLNGGELFEGVCLCKDGFAGQSCEYINPSVCNVEWTKAATTNKRRTSYSPDVVEYFDYTNQKIIFRDSLLNVETVMKAMDAERDVSDTRYYWFFVTFPFFQKITWNTFHESPQRQFMHVLINGNSEILSINASSRRCSVTNRDIDFSFLTPVQTRFGITRQMLEDWALIVDDLSNGYEIFDSTSTHVNYEKQEVEVQLADRFLNMYIGQHFVNPPVVINYKYVLGVKTSKARSLIGQGLSPDMSGGDIKNIVYLNPCWTSMSEDIYDRNQSNNGWKMLGTYLRLGNDVRIKIGSSYHSVLEVIQTGDLFSFLLAPTLSPVNANPPDAGEITYGVRSLITSSAMFKSCTHQIEGEEVIANTTHKSAYNVTWFVDTRKWNNVFAVFSNSSVLHGSVANLIAGIRQGSDVRIWIKWLRNDVSRFLDTHMSSVTENGKVSTESLVTWRTTIDSGVHLSLRCDLQYVLVTTDGGVEILSFNIWTPGTSELQSDVMITWFLG